MTETQATYETPDKSIPVIQGEPPGQEASSPSDGIPFITHHSSLIISIDDIPAPPGRCRIDDCPKPLKARGLCSIHYQQWVKGKLEGFPPYTRSNFKPVRNLVIAKKESPMMPEMATSTPPPLQRGIEGDLSSLSNLCKVPGCKSPHKARGFCGKHYDQWRDNGLDGFPPFQAVKADRRSAAKPKKTFVKKFLAVPLEGYDILDDLRDSGHVHMRPPDLQALAYIVAGLKADGYGK